MRAAEDYDVFMEPLPDVRSINPSLCIDQRVVLHAVSWEQYESLLKMRGDEGGVRVTYLRGELELMTPSRQHEGIKSSLARLLGAWAEETDTDLNAFGSWTVRSQPTERGVEPDECYVLGAREVEVPDMALEVIWTSGGIEKLEVYRGLGVREVWFWQNESLDVFVLRGGRYERSERSELLPSLDLQLLASFVDPQNQSRATRAYRAALNRA